MKECLNEIRRLIIKNNLPFLQEVLNGFQKDIKIDIDRDSRKIEIDIININDKTAESLLLELLKELQVIDSLSIREYMSKYTNIILSLPDSKICEEIRKIISFRNNYRELLQDSDNERIYFEGTLFHCLMNVVNLMESDYKVLKGVSDIKLPWSKEDTRNTISSMNVFGSGSTTSRDIEDDIALHGLQSVTDSIYLLNNIEQRANNSRDLFIDNLICNIYESLKVGDLKSVRGILDGLISKDINDYKNIDNKIVQSCYERCSKSNVVIKDNVDYLKSISYNLNILNKNYDIVTDLLVSSKEFFAGILKLRDCCTIVFGESFIRLYLKDGDDLQTIAIIFKDLVNVLLNYK